MSDFKGVLIEDSRLQLTDEIKFGVMCGASQSNFQPYNAVSTSNSNVNFNISVGSENLIIDRHLLIQAEINFTVNCANVPIPDPDAVVNPEGIAFNWGWTEGFGLLPIQSLMQSCSCTINNTTVTNNVIDILAMVSRLNDSRILSSYNSTTASMPDDSYCQYSDGVGATNNPLSSYNNSGFDSDFTGRASLNTEIVVVHQIYGGAIDNSLISTSLGDTWKIYIKAMITEPFVCMSPWIGMSPSDDPGLMGISNITFNMQLDSNLNRMFRTANATVNAGFITPSYITSVVPGTNVGGSSQPNVLNDCRLLFNFLSMQPDQAARLKSSRNIVPYLEYPRFISTATTNPIIPSKGTYRLQSQSLQFNMVNDLILVAVRIPMSSQSYANSDSWLTITGVSISYNNQSGILASCDPTQLFNISKRNGSGQNYQEFGGLATNGSAVSGAIQIGTTGSLLVLNPALDFNLDPSLASSSLGQFQFQISISCYNQYNFAVQPEIILVCVNSGIFVTMNGTSEIQKGILTRDMVLKVKQESPASALTTSELQRLVGGKMHHRGMFNSYPLAHHYKHYKPHAQREGGAVSGGSAVHSGGAISGGRLARYKK